MDNRLALMCGIDFPIPECQLIIHQPKIEEIALIGEKDFFSGVQTLCLNKSMFADETVLKTTNNFQVFMTIISKKEAADKKFAVQQVFPLFFPNYKMSLTPRSIIAIGKDGTILIDENNFEFLQEAISDICCLKSGSQDQQTFNPANKKAREIAEKIMRGRQRVAEQKGAANASIFSQHLSVLAVGLKMPLQFLQQLTIYQLYYLMERYILNINWDIDIRSRLAGAKVEGQPDNWMKNIR